jgi:hypothetical protein
MCRVTRPDGEHLQTPVLPDMYYILRPGKTNCPKGTACPELAVCSQSLTMRGCHWRLSIQKSSEKEVSHVSNSNSIGNRCKQRVGF